MTKKPVKKPAKKDAPTTKKHKYPSRIVIPDGMTPDEARQLLKTDRSLRDYVKEGVEGMVKIPDGLDAGAVTKLLHLLSVSVPGEKLSLEFGQIPGSLQVTHGPAFSKRDAGTDEGDQKTAAAGAAKGLLFSQVAELGGSLFEILRIQKSVSEKISRLDGGTKEEKEEINARGLVENGGDPSTLPIFEQLRILQKCANETMNVSLQTNDRLSELLR